MTEHTPTGLVVGRTFLTHNHPTRFWETDVNDDLNRIIATTSGETQEEAAAIGAFIVKACNAHEALVAALELARSVVKGYGGVGLQQRVAEALALAKGATLPATNCGGGK